MPHTLYIHIANAEPVLLDVQDIPTPADTCIVGTNPRRRDGKDVDFILGEVNTVVFPLHRINYVEVMPSGEEEEIITFVRE
jgi:hypothetical protein